MNLQTAKSLIKEGNKVIGKGKQMNKYLSFLDDLVILKQPKQYIPLCQAKTATDFLNEQLLLNCLKWSALFKTFNALRNMKNKEISDWKKINKIYQIDLVEMAKSHGYLVTAMYAHRALLKARIDLDKKTNTHVTNLFLLYCIDSLLRDGNSISVSGYFSPKQARMLNEAKQILLLELRPQLLNLVESFQLDDNFLNTTIGNYDGNVYERMLDYSRKSKFNHQDVIPGIKEYLQPQFKAKL